MLVPRLQEFFEVEHARTVAEGVRVVENRPVAACVSKLGTEDCLGRDVIAALRHAQRRRPFVAIHSATAARNASLRAQLDRELGIDLFTSHGAEDELVDALRSALEKPRVLLFAPPNDPGFAGALSPMLADSFEVDCVEEAGHGGLRVREQEYAACIAKLGTAGNFGCDVIKAFRGEFGASPFVAIHSATAARKPGLRAQLAEALGVSFFAEHGQESELLAALKAATARHP
jgi:DNA-binding NarL/FixJ family response regulator